MRIEEIIEVYGEFVRVRATGNSKKVYTEKGYVEEDGYFNVKIVDLPRRSKVKLECEGSVPIPFADLLKLDNVVKKRQIKKIDTEDGLEKYSEGDDRMTLVNNLRTATLGFEEALKEIKRLKHIIATEPSKVDLFLEKIDKHRRELCWMQAKFSNTMREVSEQRERIERLTRENELLRSENDKLRSENDKLRSA